MNLEQKAEYVMEHHPCYSKEAHFKQYRLHLPVAYKCNLGCKFCDRSIGKSGDNRPGVADKIMLPEEASEFVDKCLEDNPNLSIIGIAGPGEPLFNRETFITLKMIKNRHPHIRFCMSTNGVLLENEMDTIVNLGVETISITLNSLDIKNMLNLYRNVVLSDSTILTDEQAAQYILKKQRSALECLSKSGVIFKVNTILFSGINECEIENISSLISQYGAILHNIVPYIPVGELANTVRKVSSEQIANARNTSQKYMKQFTHCKQCRADAYGVPGELKTIHESLYRYQPRESN